MPPKLKAELLKGVPNLLEPLPTIHTFCGKCGQEDSSKRFSPGEDGQLLEIEECVHCGYVKSERIMPSGR